MDDRPSFFGDRNRETASCRAILVSVDNCENVDKMWVGVTRESADAARRHRRGRGSAIGARSRPVGQPTSCRCPECLARRGCGPARAIVTPDAPPAIAARGSACPLGQRFRRATPSGQHADVDVGPSHRAPGLRAPGLIRPGWPLDLNDVDGSYRVIHRGMIRGRLAQLRAWILPAWADSGFDREVRSVVRGRPA